MTSVNQWPPDLVPVVRAVTPLLELRELRAFLSHWAAVSGLAKGNSGPTFLPFPQKPPGLPESLTQQIHISRWGKQNMQLPIAVFSIACI